MREVGSIHRWLEADRDDELDSDSDDYQSCMSYT